MSRNLICQVSDIKIQFLVAETGGFWTTWYWKLDPYLISISPVESDCLIHIGWKSSVSEQITVDDLEQRYKEESGFFQKQIHRTENKNTVWSCIQKKDNKVWLQFEVTSDWKKIALLRDETNTAGTAAFEYLAHIMPAVFLKHGFLTLHSALVEYKGQAFAVCAPSGTGKTTHARLWRDYKNALILNGDRTVVGRRDGWTAYGTPWSGTSGEQMNRRAPLKALVILERSLENSVEKLDGILAFAGTFPHLLYPGWDREMGETAIDLLNDLLSGIPVYRLRCRPDAEAVNLLCRELYEE